MSTTTEPSAAASAGLGWPQTEPGPPEGDHHDAGLGWPDAPSLPPAAPRSTDPTTKETR